MQLEHRCSKAMVTFKDPFDMSAQAAICACNQLSSLVLRPLLDDAGLPSESCLLQMFVAFLPELRVLLFQTAR